MTPEELLKITEAFQNRQLLLQQQGGETIARLWDQFGGLDDAAKAKFVAEAVPIAEAIQLQAAANQIAYVEAYGVAALDEPVQTNVDPSDFTGEAIRGVSLEEEYERPVTKARAAASQGASFQQAMQRGRDYAMNLGRTDSALSARAAAAETMRRLPGVVGYRRVPDGNACQFCLLASTQRYHLSRLMPIHPACGCSVVPIFGNKDPGQIIDRETRKRLKSFSDGVSKRRAQKREVNYQESVQKASQARIKAADVRKELETEKDPARRKRLEQRAENWDRKAEAIKAEGKERYERAKAQGLVKLEPAKVVDHPELGPILQRPSKPKSTTFKPKVVAKTSKPAVLPDHPSKPTDVFKASKRQKPTGGPNEDLKMKAIQEAQGFDGKPKLVTKREYEKLVASGEVKYDGLRGISSRGGSAKLRAQQLKTGRLHTGVGLYGSGTYTATGRDRFEVADTFTGGRSGQMVRVGLQSDARVITHKDAERLQLEYRADIARRSRELPSNASDADRLALEEELELSKDLGRVNALHGYDAMVIPDAGAFYQGRPDFDELVIYNRSRTVIVE